MPGWLGALGSALGFVVFLGAVVVYLRGSKDKGTIETLERNNQALTERVGLLEASELRHVANEAALEARVGVLETEKATLQAQRPSAEKIVEIQRDVASLLGLSRTHDSETRALLMAIATTLGERDDSDK